MALDDMFLKIEGARQGPIKGGSVDDQHKDEIELSSWTWGMSGNVDAYLSNKGRTTMEELVITKALDSASTGLMSALRNNEPIKNAQLTVRKADGDKALEYLHIVLENARITGLHVASGHGSGVVEEVRIGYQKIRVEYQGQGNTGVSRGASTFEADVSPSA